MNELSKPAENVGPLRRAWARVSMVSTSSEPYGRARMTIGFLHKDRGCYYLNPRRFDTCQSDVVEMTGDILEKLDWCSRCSPEEHRERRASASVVGPSAIEGSSRRVFPMPAATKLLGAG